MAELILTYDTVTGQTKWVDSDNCTEYTPGEYGTPSLGGDTSAIEQSIVDLTAKTDQNRNCIREFYNLICK